MKLIIESDQVKSENIVKILKKHFELYEGNKTNNANNVFVRKPLDKIEKEINNAT